MGTEPWTRCAPCSLEDLQCSFSVDHKQVMAESVSERILRLEGSLASSQAEITKLKATYQAETAKFQMTLQAEVAKVRASFEIKVAGLDADMQRLSGIVRQLQDELTATTSRTRETHAYVLQFALPEDK